MTEEEEAVQVHYLGDSCEPPRSTIVAQARAESKEVRLRAAKKWREEATRRVNFAKEEWRQAERLVESIESEGGG